MVESDYEIMSFEDGTEAIVRSDGAAINIQAFEIMFELHRQNPKFFETWLNLAEDYLLMSLPVGEA